MPAIRRLFVEKKPAFAVEAGTAPPRPAGEPGHRAAWKGVRLVVRYDVEGLDGAGPGGGPLDRVRRTAGGRGLRRGAAPGPGETGPGRGIPARAVRPARRLAPPSASSCCPTAPGPRWPAPGSMSCGARSPGRTWTGSAPTWSTPWTAGRPPRPSPGPCSPALPGPRRGGKCWRASPPRDGAGLAGLHGRMGLAMTLADLRAHPGLFPGRGAPRPHRDRAAPPGHLLVRPLPPHHLPHRASPTWPWTTGP